MQLEIFLCVLCLCTSIFGKCSESCWFVFSTEILSYIRNIGQNVGHMLETLAKEETQTTGKLDSYWRKLARLRDPSEIVSLADLDHSMQDDMYDSEK